MSIALTVQKQQGTDCMSGSCSDQDKKLLKIAEGTQDWWQRKEKLHLVPARLGLWIRSEDRRQTSPAAAVLFFTSSAGVECHGVIVEVFVPSSWFRCCQTGFYQLWFLLQPTHVTRFLLSWTETTVIVWHMKRWTAVFTLQFLLVSRQVELFSKVNLKTQLYFDLFCHRRTPTTRPSLLSPLSRFVFI